MRSRGAGVRTRLHGMSTARPRRRRDSPPRNVHVAVGADPAFPAGEGPKALYDGLCRGAGRLGLVVKLPNPNREAAEQKPCSSVCLSRGPTPVYPSRGPTAVYPSRGPTPEQAPIVERTPTLLSNAVSSSSSSVDAGGLLLERSLFFFEFGRRPQVRRGKPRYGERSRPTNVRLKAATRRWASSRGAAAATRSRIWNRSAAAPS